MYLDNGIWRWKYSTTEPKATGYEDVVDSYNIIPVEDFKALTLEEQIPYAEQVLGLIREVNVYPIYYFSDEGIKAEIKKCLDSSVFFSGEALVEHGRSGAVLLDFLFPNMHRVDAGGAIHNNMYSRFYDDEKMIRILVRHMKNYRFTSMRTPFFMYGRFFWNTATSFSPMRAKAVYERFAPAGGTVYDFSAGFGGRMLGALSSKHNYTYIGCEPCSNTFYNLRRLGRYIESVTQRSRSYLLYNACSEQLRLPKASVDFAFSCPPYFNVERYCDEPTQSIQRFPKYNTWLAGYVRWTMQNVAYALKPGARCGVILAGTIYVNNKPLRLASDWKHEAELAGLTYEQSYALSTMSRKKPENAEMLLMFRKE